MNRKFQGACIFNKLSLYSLITCVINVLISIFACWILLHRACVLVLIWLWQSLYTTFPRYRFYNHYKKNRERITCLFFLAVSPVWQPVFHYKLILKTSKQLNCSYFWFDMLFLLVRCDIFRVLQLHFLFILQQRGKNMVAYDSHLFFYPRCLLR